MSKKDDKNFDELVRALLSLKAPKETIEFLKDLMTRQEMVEFAKRWQAARMLEESIPYSKIEAETGLSSRTVARVSRCLKGKVGGYRLILGRLGLRSGHHSSSRNGKGTR